MSRDPLEFSGRSALVTGAARGIGLAVATHLARYGASVAMVDRDEAALNQAAGDLRAAGHEALSIVADVAVRAEAEHAVASCVGHFGRLEIVSNNAGIQRYGTIQSTEDSDWDEVMNVNVRSAVLVTRAAVPHLREVRGNVVNMASVQSFVSQQNALAYTASKHALLGVTRSMALDLAGAGVRVNCVAPGSVDTPMLDWALDLDPDPAALRSRIEAMHPLGRIAQPHEIAECVAFLASGRASFVTGASLVVDGGLLLALGGSPLHTGNPGDTP